MDIIEIFKDFHRHPELSYQEFRTTEKIKEILASEGVEILPLNLETGLVAIIRGGKADSSSKTVAFRCDIDALPVSEQTNLEYKSLENGKMHACGHDIHISTGIKIACLLNKEKSSLDRNFVIIFQPAEEHSDGALKILETGLLENEKIEAIVALHVNPELESGVLGIREGAATSSVDKFSLTIKGRGAHGAKPENSIDPIVAASHFATGIQSVISRNVSPLQSAVISITHFESGDTWNTIPEKAFLEGTCRTSSKETRLLIEEKFKNFVKGNDISFGTETELEYLTSNPATDNDVLLCEKARQVAQENNLKAIIPPLSMVGEDFAYYQEKTKGLLVWVGSGIGENLHSPKFHADYKILEYIPEYFVKLLKKI